MNVFGYHTYDLTFVEQLYLADSWDAFETWCQLSLEYVPKVERGGPLIESLIFFDEADLALFRLAWTLDIPEQYVAFAKNQVVSWKLVFPGLGKPSPTSHHRPQPKRPRWVSPWDQQHVARINKRNNNRRG